MRAASRSIGEDEPAGLAPVIMTVPALGYRAWYAHITLAMLAAAYLAATRAQEVKKGNPRPVATV